jgi:hypothetical protein
MDFMRVLRSFEELLYEVASWLVFYPLTMWKALRRPQAMMRYADAELADTPEAQYTDTLSPPLFLLVSLLLAHGAELAVKGQGVAWSRPALLASDANLLAFRALSFAIFPLLMSVQLLHRRGVPIDRRTLRPPFYSQCYAVAPPALGVSLGALMAGFHRLPLAAGLAVVAGSLAWYVTVEARWFAADLRVSAARAVGIVVGTVLLGTVIMVVGAALLAYGSGAAG